MDEGFYVWISIPHLLTGFLFHSMPESAAGWTAAGGSPKYFYFVNLFPSGTKFGPGSGKSHPMHFLSRPRVGLIWHFLCYEFYGQLPCLYLCTKGNSLPERIPPLDYQAKAALPSFLSMSYSIFLHFPIHFPSKPKILKIDFLPLMKFYILFFRPISPI